LTYDKKDVKLAQYKTSTVILAAVLIAVAVGAALVVVSVLTHGNVNTTSNLSVAPNNIDWGSFDAGTSVTKLVTLTNTGNAPLLLTYTYSSYANFLLTWNATNYILPVGASAAIAFTLITP
jgi:hypothetical protein